MIPIQHYATQAALFFAMSFLNNAAFGYAISQPVHMVVRSSNLIVTCLFGYFLGKRCARCVSVVSKPVHSMTALTMSST